MTLNAISEPLLGFSTPEALAIEGANSDGPRFADFDDSAWSAYALKALWFRGRGGIGRHARFRF
jgi:hypothetical protein